MKSRRKWSDGRVRLHEHAGEQHQRAGPIANGRQVMAQNQFERHFDRQQDDADRDQKLPQTVANYGLRAAAWGERHVKNSA
jgi:hypothetical protein